MNEHPNDTETAKLLNKRRIEYGQAWLKTGQMIRVIPDEFHSFCVVAPQYIYPWVTILCKLLRALVTPFNQDHWADIAGYATLVRDDIYAHTPGEAHLKNPPTI